VHLGLLVDRRGRRQAVGRPRQLRDGALRLREGLGPRAVQLQDLGSVDQAIAAEHDLRMRLIHRARNCINAAERDELGFELRSGGKAVAGGIARS
jgi:hypothetical protein